MNKFLKFRPHYLILLGYILISLIFSLILLLPFSHKGNLNFIDALFTSVSSLCVTGLIVKDTETFWTFEGKLIILFLIQIGGLGYMTLVSYFIFVLRGGVPISLRVITKRTQSFLKGIPVRDLVLKILVYTLIIEFTGFLILLFLSKGERKFFDSLFHSISAFCNAGFSTYSENISRYKDSPLYLLTISILLILGGLGFFVLDDIYNFIRKRTPLSYHSKVVLKTTVFLLVFFTFIFLLIEWDNSLKDYNLQLKIIHSFFHVSVPRTAGFNAVDISALLLPTQLIIMFLMVIGGSPGGTAGGIKTTNFAIWASFLRSTLKGEEEVSLSQRRVDNSLLIESASIFSLYIFVFGFSLFVILLIEKENFTFLELVFEVISALSTVGLSMGSKNLGNVSLSCDFLPITKFIIIILMIIGRIGVFTFWSLIVTRKKTLKAYPKGELMVF
ncbi:MAG: potassium transporter TrkG [Candidatus Hydrothermales bacterium]